MLLPNVLNMQFEASFFNRLRMRGDTNKFFASTFTAFSLFSGISQVFALDEFLRWSTLGLTAVCGSGAFLFYRRAQAHQMAVAALEGLLKRLPVAHGYVVRNIADEAELKELWEIDNEGYGDASIPFDTFIEWWRAYPSGLFALFEGSAIVGGFGLWPLRRTVFKEFAEGKRRERDIKARSLERNQGRTSLRNWYVSGIVLKTRFRKTKAIKMLLSGALSAWLKRIKNEQTLSICALAYSREGEAMLKRFGFHKYKDVTETVDRYPIYALLSLRTSDLKEKIGRLCSETASEN